MPAWLGSRTPAPGGRRGPVATPSRSLADALEATPTVAGVLAGHREAAACYVLIEPLLPSGLASQLRPGPLQEGTWTLFAAGNASAAKARQLLPRLLERLQAVRADVQAVKVKIVPLPEASATAAAGAHGSVQGRAAPYSPR
ncbi:MAG: hypothetical protein RI988_3065 [Pseudomonadota bacterium]